MHKILFFLFLALLAFTPASGQTLIADVGELTVTPSTITYRTPAREAIVSRDLLAALPRAGQYQFTDDDLALILDAAEWSGAEVPAWVPAADPGLTALLDSLQGAATRAAQTIDAQKQQIAKLASDVASRDAALAAMKKERDAALAKASDYEAFVAGVRRILRDVLPK